MFSLYLVILNFATWRTKTMTNLTIFNEESRNLKFDWVTIQDEESREYVKALTTDYWSTHDANHEEVKGIFTNLIIERARVVSEAKERLPRGEFSQWCSDAMGISKDARSSLLHIHQKVMDGSVSDDVKAMLSSMEPRAASKLLKADEATQQKHLNEYQDSGRLPSRRDFEPKPKTDWQKRQESQQRMDYNNNRAVENAFADSPQSQFYKAPQEPVAAPVEPINVTPTEVSLDISEDVTDVSETVVSPLWDELYSLQRQMNSVRKKFLSYPTDARIGCESYIDNIERELGLLKEMTQRAKY